jgi:hypothetical protein
MQCSNWIVRKPTVASSNLSMWATQLGLPCSKLNLPHNGVGHRRCTTARVLFTLYQGCYTVSNSSSCNKEAHWVYAITGILMQWTQENKGNSISKEHYEKGTRDWMSSIMHKTTVLQSYWESLDNLISIHCNKLHLSTKLLGKEDLRVSNRGYFTVFQKCELVKRSLKFSKTLEGL